MRQISTVRGELDPDKLGVTQPHEHFFINILNCWMDGNADQKLLKVPVTMDILADLKRKDGQCEDMMTLASFEDAVNEAARFSNFGGRSIVDLTVPGIGREVKSLRKLSEATGLNILCGTGWYIEASHPPLVKQKSAQELAEIMIREIEEEIEGTGIRAAVIGELGCSEPLTPNEMKVLAAGAITQRKTHAPLTVHSAMFDVENKRAAKQVRQEVEILRKNDADLSRVYVSHMDWTFDDPAYHERLMEDFPVTLAYDGFGQEQYYDNIYLGAGGVTDRERVGTLTQLLHKGFEKQLLLSCDVNEKIHLRKYGGWGYSHILEHIIPALKQNGVSDRQIETMMINNPKRLFTR
jgi:phosphotriesterase-related protein